VTLGTPAVFRGRTARDFRALAGMPDAVPVSSREFSRTERLVIRIPVYTPQDVPLTVSARLQNRKGQTMRTLTAEPVAARSFLREIDLPLAGFAAGDYRIEFAATTPGASTTEVLDLRVTNWKGLHKTTGDYVHAAQLRHGRHSPDGDKCTPPYAGPPGISSMSARRRQTLRTSSPRADR
jgi:hypothetical protein